MLAVHNQRDCGIMAKNRFTSRRKREVSKANREGRAGNMEAEAGPDGGIIEDDDGQPQLGPASPKKGSHRAEPKVTTRRACKAGTQASWSSPVS